MAKPAGHVPHTQKTAAERAQDIEVSRGGAYAKDKWVAMPQPKPREA
jgi:hypothetical protein